MRINTPQLLYRYPFLLIGLSIITFYLIHKTVIAKGIQSAVTLWNVERGNGGFQEHQNPLLMNPWLAEFLEEVEGIFEKVENGRH